VKNAVERYSSSEILVLSVVLPIYHMCQTFTSHVQILALCHLCYDVHCTFYSRRY
jgi:hypothetical protein